MAETIEQILTGGHPNSLGRTIEVVELVLVDPDRFEELFNCFRSSDEVVRLRTSNAIKRVESERHDLLVPYVERLLNEISEIDQASTQWTIAQLFDRLSGDLSDAQRERALAIMKRNLAEHDDWIVLNTTTEILSNWAADDEALKSWLKPHLERLSSDSRKSVANRAKKKLKLFGF
ncbi:MAG: hypothetical protein AAF468_05935 [Pseudomonadota bacterium]